MQQHCVAAYAAQSQLVPPLLLHVTRSRVTNSELIPYTFGEETPGENKDINIGARKADRPPQ